MTRTLSAQAHLNPLRGIRPADFQRKRAARPASPAGTVIPVRSTRAAPAPHGIRDGVKIEWDIDPVPLNGGPSADHAIVIRPSTAPPSTQHSMSLSRRERQMPHSVAPVIPR